MHQGQQQQLRAGALRPHSQTRAHPAYVFNRSKIQWICWRNDQALFTPTKGDHHRILQSTAVFYSIDVCVGFCIVEDVEVDRGSKRLAGGETSKSCFAANRQRRQTRAALAQGPFEQRVMTSADDRRRLGWRRSRRS
jgi:hypothetical protein